MTVGVSAGKPLYPSSRPDLSGCWWKSRHKVNEWAWALGKLHLSQEESQPSIPAHLPSPHTQPGALSRRLSAQLPGIAGYWLCCFFGVTKHTAAVQDTSISPSTGSHSMVSYCKAGVLLWQTLNSCLLQEKGSCAWVNRFKFKYSSPSPVAHLWYNTKMSHRN